MTPAQFDTWLLRAEPGEPLIYHVGHLHIGTLYGVPDPVRIALAARVREASEAGFVALTQMRHGDNFSYLATRTGEIAG